jgi:MinD-like ATPase involved in chromosome partitioning or flagellar assembly
MIPNDYRRVQSSLDLGHPIVTDAPTSPARVAIQEMAKKLASDRLGDERTLAAPSGFLGKLWRRSG